MGDHEDEDDSEIMKQNKNGHTWLQEGKGTKTHLEKLLESKFKDLEIFQTPIDEEFEKWKLRREENDAFFDTDFDGDYDYDSGHDDHGGNEMEGNGSTDEVKDIKADDKSDTTSIVGAGGVT